MWIEGDKQHINNKDAGRSKGRYNYRQDRRTIIVIDLFYLLEMEQETEIFKLIDEKRVISVYFTLYNLFIVNYCPKLYWSNGGAYFQ